MPLKLLTHDFYGRSTPKVARDLLGKLLVRTLGRRRLVGRIVEVEAYLAKSDPACHAARGRTKSNTAMFGRPGRAYVYPIHSRHCFNIVTEADGVGTAVLIRAVEPIEGIKLMMEHRHRDKRPSWPAARAASARPLALTAISTIGISRRAGSFGSPTMEHSSTRRMRVPQRASG